jgi:outer membrane protein OmpA-like peptidoglycan-associated protein
MSGNLISNLMGMATPEMVSQLSQMLGESAPATSKGLGVALPLLLAGASKLAASDNGTSLTDLIKTAGADPSMLSNLAGYFGSANSAASAAAPTSALSSLFGPATGGVLTALASMAGLRGASVNSMMGLAAPLVLGMLGKHQATSGLSASGLAGLLASHKADIAKALPPEFSSLLNLNAPTATPHAAYAAPVAAVSESKGINWPLWLGIGAAVIAGLLALRGCDTKPVAPAVVAPAATAVNHYKLPDGTLVDLLPDSFGFNLATFLEKGAATDVPKTFVFDHLNYDFGTTTLTADSKGTVTALISILKAYPGVNVELAGHTDNVGDPAANLALSESRAKAIQEMLVAGGIDAARITTVGYGETKPIAPNDTDDGRQKNRRTELTVTKK